MTGPLGLTYQLSPTKVLSLIIALTLITAAGALTKALSLTATATRAQSVRRAVRSVPTNTELGGIFGCALQLCSIFHAQTNIRIFRKHDSAVASLAESDERSVSYGLKANFRSQPKLPSNIRWAYLFL